MHKKGSIYGLLSGFFWGFDSVVLGIALGFPLMLKLGVQSSLITTFIHDTFSFILLMILIFKLSKGKELVRVLKSKSGLAVIAAALLGGPIGMAGYIMSINYLGATLASSISAIYPAVGLLLAYLFLKEKMKVHNILGLLLAIAAIIMMGVSPNISVSNPMLGFLSITLTIIGWGSEAVIISAALKEEVSSEVALAIRQLTTSVTYAIFIMPLIGYDKLMPVIKNPTIITIILASGIIGTLSYLAYYKSIDMIGATQAMGLNITYPAWAFIIQFLITKEFSLYLFALSLVIMLGSIMSNENPKEIFEIFSKDKPRPIK